MRCFSYVQDIHIYKYTLQVLLHRLGTTFCYYEFLCTKNVQRSVVHLDIQGRLQGLYTDARVMIQAVPVDTCPWHLVS